MSDAIHITGLRLLGAHGVLEEEKRRPQPFEVDLCLEWDIPANGSDDLHDVVNYALVIEQVAKVFSSRHFDLMETMADQMAVSVMADERLARVTVEVRKLRPPIPFDVKSVAVRVSRERKDV